VLVVAILALTQTGCVGMVVTPPEPVSLAPGPGGSARFTYPDDPVRPVRLGEPRPLADDYTVTRLKFTPGRVPTEQAFALLTNYYRGSGGGPRPLLIVVPIWGSGEYRYPSTKFTQHVRSSSGGRFDVIEILGSPPLLPWRDLAEAPTPDAFVQRAEVAAERVRLAVITIRRMVDWAGAREQTDHDSIFITGFSMGAIVTSILLGNDQRFAGAVLAMGGSEFDRIFAHCDGRAGKLRQTILDRFGWSKQQYREVFERVFAAGQPSNFHGNYDPQRILLMDAGFDDCIPERSRESLWHALGKPERITFLASHRMAFLAFTPIAFGYGNRRAFEFLQQHVPEPDTQYAHSEDD